MAILAPFVHYSMKMEVYTAHSMLCLGDAKPTPRGVDFVQQILSFQFSKEESASPYDGINELVCRRKLVETIANMYVLIPQIFTDKLPY